LRRQYRPARSSDVRSIVLDPNLIATELGWTAQTDIYSGVDATWKWLRKTLR
jgi:nucleoside-diphosphate-sugar epimerase